MDALLERLSPGQIVAVISVLCGSFAFVVLVFAITKYHFQALADETALRRERQQAEFALREKLLERGGATEANVDALLNLEDAEEEEYEEEEYDYAGELAKRFGRLTVPPEEMADVLRQAVASDAQRQQMIMEVMDQLFEDDASCEAVLAVVRPLCRPADSDEGSSPLSPLSPLGFPFGGA